MSSWKYELTGPYIATDLESEGGFDSEEEAEEAVHNRINEIMEDYDLEPQDEMDFDWEIVEDEEG